MSTGARVTPTTGRGYNGLRGRARIPSLRHPWVALRPSSTIRTCINKAPSTNRVSATLVAAARLRLAGVRCAALISTPTRQRNAKIARDLPTCRHVGAGPRRRRLAPALFPVPSGWMRLWAQMEGMARFNGRTDRRYQTGCSQVEFLLASRASADPPEAACLARCFGTSIAPSCSRGENAPRLPPPTRHSDAGHLSNSVSHNSLGLRAANPHPRVPPESRLWSCVLPLASPFDPLPCVCFRFSSCSASPFRRRPPRRPHGPPTPLLSPLASAPRAQPTDRSRRGPRRRPP